MRNFFLLSKILLRSIGDIFGVNATGKRRKWSTGLIIFVIALGLLSYVAPMWALSFTLTEQLRAFDLTDLIPLIIVPIGILMTVVFSIFTVIGMFYLSTDTRILLPLPVKPWQIVAARFVTTLVTIYMVEVLFFIPALTGWVVGAQAPIDVYGYVLLVLLVTPLAPTAVMTLLIGVIMSAMPVIKNKDAFTYFIMFFAIALSLGLSVGMQSIFSYLELDPNELATSLQAIVTVLQTTVLRFLPFLEPVYESLIGATALDRFVGFLLYFTGSASMIVAVIYLLGIIYIRTVMGMGEAPSKKRKLSQSEWSSHNRDISVFWRYVGKEIKIMLRSPTYFLNLIFVNILVPAILVVTFVSSASMFAEDPDIQALITLLNSIDGSIANGKTVAILLGVMIGFSGLSMISPTAISRDGKNAWVMKMIPVTPMAQVNMKVFWGVVIAMATYLLIGGAFVYMGIIDLLGLLIVFVAFTVIQLFANYLGILFDILWPKLTWDNEAVAVKQNLNGVFFMLIEMALAVGIGFGGFYFIDLVYPLSGYLLLVVIISLFGVAAVTVYWLMQRRGDRLFERIQ